MSKKNKKAKAQGMLPKRIAGVKIPKPLRRQGHHLSALARHPLVVDLVAAGIVALAAGLRDHPKVQAANGEPAAPETKTPRRGPRKPAVKAPETAH